MSALLKLAERCEAAVTPAKLRFSLCQGRGWVTTSDEECARLLADLWNNRAQIGAALSRATDGGEAK